MTIQQMQHRLNTFVMRGERVVGEVVNDWRSWAVLGTAVLGFVVAQNWEGLKQTMNTWFTPDEISPRATMVALIPTQDSNQVWPPLPKGTERMFVPSTPTAVKSTETSVPPATKVPDATAMAQPTPAESGPKVQTVIFDGGKLTIQEVIAAGSREGVKPLSQVSIYSNYVSIGVVPEAVYVANDNKIYCRCYLDTGAPIDFEISSASISIPGQRTAPITPDQYGKLQNDLLGKSAALNITPNESVAGWNIYTIKKYLSISHVTGETLLTFRK